MFRTDENLTSNMIGLLIKNPALLTSVFSAVLLQNGIRMSTCALNSKFSHETGAVISRSPPGLNSGLKLWWAKQVTPEYYVAGRLSRRQLQYAAEGGFKSVVSLFTYENDKDCCLGMDYLPETSKMATIAKESGLQFRTVMDSGGDLAIFRRFRFTTKTGTEQYPHSRTCAFRPGLQCNIYFVYVFIKL